MKSLQGIAMGSVLAAFLALLPMGPLRGEDESAKRPAPVASNPPPAVVTDLLKAQGLLEAGRFTAAGLPPASRRRLEAQINRTESVVERLHPACRAFLAGGEALARVSASLEDAFQADLAMLVQSDRPTQAVALDPIYPPDFAFLSANASNAYGHIRLTDEAPGLWATPALWTGELQPATSAGYVFQKDTVLLTSEFTSLVRSDFRIDDAEVAGEVKVDEGEIFLILRSDVIVKFRIGKLRKGGSGVNVKFGFDNLRSVNTATQAAETESGRWYSFRITLRGRRLSMQFDGADVLETTISGDPRLSGSQLAPAGHFGWGGNDGAGAFRNVGLRALSSAGRLQVPRLRPAVVYAPDGPAVRMLESGPENFVSLVHEKTEPFNAQKHSVSNGVLMLKGAAYFQVARKDMVADHFRAQGKVNFSKSGSVWFRVNQGLLFGLRCGTEDGPLAVKHGTMNFNSVDEEKPGEELKPGREYTWELEYHEPVGSFRLEGRPPMVSATVREPGKSTGPNQLGISSYNTAAEIREVTIQRLVAGGTDDGTRARQAAAFLDAGLAATDRAMAALKKNADTGAAAALAILQGTGPAVIASFDETTRIAERFRDNHDWHTYLSLLEANGKRFPAGSDWRRRGEADWKKARDQYQETVKTVAPGELGPDSIVRVGNKPGPMFSAGDGRHVWISVSPSKELVRLDPVAGKVVTRLTLKGELAFAVGRGTYLLGVFAGDRGNLHKVSLEDGQIMASVALPKGTLLDVVEHPRRPRTFVAMDENQKEETLDLGQCRIHMLDEAAMTLQPTDGIGQFLAVDPLGRYLYAGFRVEQSRGVELDPAFLRVMPVGPFLDHLVKYRLAATNLTVEEQRPAPGVGGLAIVPSPDGQTVCYLAGRGCLNLRKKKLDENGVAAYRATNLERPAGVFDAGSRPAGMEFNAVSDEVYILTGSQGRRHRAHDLSLIGSFSLPPEVTKGTVTGTLTLPDGSGLLVAFSGKPGGVYLRRFPAAARPGDPMPKPDSEKLLADATVAMEAGQGDAFAEPLRRLGDRSGPDSAGDRAARLLLQMTSSWFTASAVMPDLAAIKLDDLEADVRLDAVVLPKMDKAMGQANGESGETNKVDEALLDRVERLLSLQLQAAEFPHAWLWECRQALTAFPKSARLKLAAADGLLRLQKLEPAAQILAAVLADRAEEGFLRVHAGLALAGIYSGKQDKGLELATLMQAAAIPPGDVAVHRRLAAAWEAAGCPRRARLAKLTAWHLFPSQPTLLKELTDVGALPAEEPQKLDVPTLFGRMSQAVVTVVHENGSGTGFLVTRSGRILTNQHVVEGGTELKVKYRDAKGEEHTSIARRIGRDTVRDMALLAIEPPPSDIAPLVLADSDKVSTGEPIVAIGNPGLGARILTNTATEGIVSGRNRVLGSCSLFQISAAVNPGNSGGPLLDRFGRVVGMVTSKTSLENVGFAVPANDLRSFVLDQEGQP